MLCSLMKPFPFLLFLFDFFSLPETPFWTESPHFEHGDVSGEHGGGDLHRLPQQFTRHVPNGGGREASPWKLGTGAQRRNSMKTLL